MKKLALLSIILLSGLSFTGCSCNSDKAKKEVSGNAINDLHAWEHPDSIAKYAVGSEHNPIIKH